MTNANLGSIGNLIWTWLFLPGLFLVSIILTIGSKGLQFRKFGYALRQTAGKMFSRKQNSPDGISSFQAAATALGATVGTGNIVGSAQALCLGGPGAIFWIWVSALLAMIVKYSEICLAIHFRKTIPGNGPMDYIRHGLHSKKLALFYGFMALLSSLAMGNIVQVSSITDAFISLADAFVSGPKLDETLSRLAIGFFLAGLSLVLICGEAKRITNAAELLVPFMVIFFILVSLAVVLQNIQRLPNVLNAVFTEAFNPGSICGGISGISTSQCIQWAFRRSAFSNEAGLGTSAIAHAAADVKSAAQQGLWGIFEVFADTIVISSCTSLCILCSGINIPWGTLSGSELFLNALETVYGNKISAIMLASFMGLFAYTSIMGWALYGSRCTEYIFGSSAVKTYHLLFILLIFIGSILPLESVWIAADLINATMSVPNLMALVLLLPLVLQIIKDSFP